MKMQHSVSHNARLYTNTNAQKHTHTLHCTILESASLPPNAASYLHRDSVASRCFNILVNATPVPINTHCQSCQKLTTVTA